MTSDGIEVFEVLDSSRDRVGYTLSPEVLASLDDLQVPVNDDVVASSGRERMSSPLLRSAAHSDGVAVRAFPLPNAMNVPLCVAAIGWFVAQTVFPAARVATLVARLGGLIAKYGVQTVARIFTGARGIAGRTAEQEIKDFALAASGVGGLAACGIDL